MDFLKRNAVFIIVTLATLILIIGGVFLFSRNSSNGAAANKVSDSVLVPDNAEATSGVVNGSYQPALSNAKVTLVEFGDYQCPACGLYNSQIIDQVLVDFAGKINYVFRDFSFIGPESLRAAEATYCAADQNEYWQYHEYLYSHQSGENKGAFSDDNLKAFAKDMGLDGKSFNSCLDSGRYQSRVDSSTNDGKLAGVNSTPSFFINGIKISNPGSLTEFESLLTKAIESSPMPSSSPEETYHAHFDLKVYVNDKMIDLSQAKYQSTDAKELDPYIHLHDGNGNVVHVHKAGVSLSELTDSIKLNFPKDTNSSSLKVYVNGKASSQGLSYIPQDLDKILISYGSIGENLQPQIASVTDDACIYSLKCPERGTPPPETCAGGLGTGCTD